MLRTTALTKYRKSCDKESVKITSTLGVDAHLGRKIFITHCIFMYWESELTLNLF